MDDKVNQIPREKKSSATIIPGTVSLKIWRDTMVTGFFSFFFSLSLFVFLCTTINHAKLDDDLELNLIYEHIYIDEM